MSIEQAAVFKAIADFASIRSESTKAASSLKDVRTEAEKTEAALRATATGSDKAEAGLKSVDAAADKAKAGLRGAGSESRTAETRMRGMGSQADRTQAQVRGVGTEADRLRTKLHRVEVQEKQTFGVRSRAAIGKFSSKMKSAGRTATTSLTAPLLLAGGLAIHTFTSFENSITSAGLKAGATKAQMQDMTDVALKMGQQTSFSAGEAAQGLDQLAQLGLTASESIAALPGVIDAAQASGSNLALTAQIVATSMNAFNLKAKDAGHIADVMAQAANTGAIDMAGLGQALAQAGQLGVSANQSLEDVVAAVSRLVTVGVPAASAGAAVRQGIQSLVAPTTKANTVLKTFGIVTRDAHGNMLPLPDLLDELQKKLGSSNPIFKSFADGTRLSDKQISQMAKTLGVSEGTLKTFQNNMGDSAHSIRDYALASLFGVEGGKAFQLMLGDTKPLILDNQKDAGKLADLQRGLAQTMGVDQAKAWIAARTNQGKFTASSQDVVRAMSAMNKASDGTAKAFGTKFMKTLGNQIDQVKGGLETLAITLVLAVKPQLIAIAHFLQAAFAWMVKFANTHPLITKIVLAFLAFLAVLGPVLLFVGLIAGAIAAIGGIAVIGTILGVVAAIVALVAAFVIAYKQVGWFRRAVDAAVDAVTRFAKWLSNPQQVAKYRAAIQSVVDTVKTLVAWFQANLLPVVVDVWNRIVAVVASAVGFLRAHWDEIRAFAISTFDKILSAVKTWWSTMLSLLGVGWDVVRGVFTALWNVIVPIVTALVAVIKDHWDEIVAWTVKTFDQIAVIVTDVLDIVVRVFNFVFPILVGIVKAAMIVIGKIIEIALALIGWAWNTFGDDLVNVIVAVFTYIGRFISAALKVIGGIVKLVLALIQGDWSGAWDAIVQILGGVWDVITATIKLALTVIKSLLGAAWSIIKSAVGTVWDWIEGRISDAWNFIKDVLGGVKDWLKDHFVSAFEAVKTALKNVLEGIANVPRLAINFVIDFVWNKGIAAAINSIASKLGLGSPLGPIKTIDPFHFAKGGVVPGQRRGKNDTVPAMVRPGEGWLTPEAVDRLGGPKGLAALNKYGTLGGIGIPNPFPVIGKAAKTALGIAGQEALSTLDDLVHKVPWLGPFLSKVSAAKQTLTDKLAGSDLLGMAGIVLSKGGQLIGNVVKFAIEKAKAWVGTATGFSGSGGAAAAAAAHDRTIDASKWASPMVPGTYGITARWMSYPGHTGIDLAGSEGTPVYSAAPGRVSASYDLPGSDPRATYQGSINPYHSYGRVVEVDHGDGTSTLYGHLLQRLVTVGNMVSAASQIGNRGHYGYVLTSQGAPDYGAHLHFETHVGGTPVNPEPFMAERGAYFDRGGMLMPGQVGINQSGKPEPVLTGEQWSRLLSGLEAQKMPRRLAHVGVGGLSDGLPVGKVDARSQRFEFNWLAPNDERPSDEIVRKMEKLSRGGLFDGDDD